MSQIDIYISLCMKDFDKAKLKRKLKNSFFVKDFFEKNFYGFSHLSLAEGRLKCICIRKFWTICTHCRYLQQEPDG